MSTLKGFGYPDFQQTPRGYLKQEINDNVIKGNLLTLLLTNHGERVMLPTYGSNLDKFLFKQSTPILYSDIKDNIISTIARWEPNIVVHNVLVGRGDQYHENVKNDLNYDDDQTVVVRITYSRKDTLGEPHELSFGLNP